jgi:nucleoside-specific outer membrane channel protein Tsx
MRKLAENMDLGMGPWKYSGVDKFYLAINRHQKVNFETPEKIKSWRDLNSHVSFENVATPRDLLGILNTILYGELEPQRI